MIGSALVTFPIALLLKPEVRNEVLRYMVLGFERVIVWAVPVPADHIPNIVFCVEMSNDFIYSTFRYGTALFGFSGFSRILLALYGLWASFEVYPTLLSFTTIIAEDQMLNAWCSCCTVSRVDVIDAVFVDGQWVRASRFYAKRKGSQILGPQSIV